MCIEFTKVEASTRQAFYDTLLMFWDQHWEKEFQQEFLADMGAGLTAKRWLPCPAPNASV